MRKSKLKKQIKVFEEVVLRDVKQNILLGSSEWFSCRAAALIKKRWVDRAFADKASPLMTPADICIASDETGLSLQEVIDHFKKQQHRAPDALQKIAGQPVLHFLISGVYLWAPDPKDKFLLSIWLTFPAYPPGW